MQINVIDISIKCVEICFECTDIQVFFLLYSSQKKKSLIPNVIGFPLKIQLPTYQHCTPNRYQVLTNEKTTSADMKTTHQCVLNKMIFLKII